MCLCGFLFCTGLQTLLRRVPAAKAKRDRKNKKIGKCAIYTWKPGGPIDLCSFIGFLDQNKCGTEELFFMTAKNCRFTMETVIF